MSTKKTSKKGANSPASFVHEVRDELQHVTWPTRSEAIHKTVIVIGISIITGLYLGALDYGFTYLSGLVYR